MQLSLTRSPADDTDIEMAVARLYDAHGVAVYSLALHMLKDTADAELVTCLVFREASGRLASTEFHVNPRRHLLVITYRYAQRLCRPRGTESAASAV